MTLREQILADLQEYTHIYDVRLVIAYISGAENLSERELNNMYHIGLTSISDFYHAENAKLAKEIKSGEQKLKLVNFFLRN